MVPEDRSMAVLFLMGNRDTGWGMEEGVFLVF
jgi:hypothetical protein